VDYVEPPIDLTGYAVYASVAVSPTVHGARGRLELLQDERLTPVLRDYIAGGGFCDERPTDHPEFCESVDREPLRPAIVRLSDATGQDIAARRLPRELAFLETAYLYGTHKPTYLVTVDLRAGAGGWAPICTYFAEVEHGTLQWLSATLATDASRSEIALCSSHHASWRTVPSVERRARDILFVAGGVDGTLGLGRYTWDGTAWQLAISRSVGSWDGDRPFPDPNQFPVTESPCSDSRKRDSGNR
jgi:hypothetical protein